MRCYQQYNLDNFYNLHYYEGGLATAQVTRMFNYIIEEKNEEIIFQAALRGIKLKDPKAPQKDEVVPMFGDPDSYDELSDEEREELTQDMMGKHKTWVATGLGK